MSSVSFRAPRSPYSPVFFCSTCLYYKAVTLPLQLRSQFIRAPFDFRLFAQETHISFSYVLYIQTTLQSYITVSSIFLK
jgi:hypothetical protein